MTENNTILILDENQQRAYGLSASLSFINETNCLVNDENYLNFVKVPESVTAFILGASSFIDHEALIRAHPAVPFFADWRYTQAFVIPSKCCWFN